LRSPLLGVSNILEIIDKKEIVTTEEERKQFLEMSRESIKFSLKMINELLNLSRIETGKIKVKKQNISVQEMTKLFLKELEPQAKLKNITIKTEIPSLLSIYIDLELFPQVLKNLITNAIKFTSENKDIEINVYTKDYIDITIKDSGIGIPKKLHRFLFQKFTQAKRRGLQNEVSTGLGMYIIHKIMTSLGGAVTIDSIENRGTSISLLLPLSKME
jgi:signal transduction histidine kinase